MIYFTLPQSTRQWGTRENNALVKAGAVAEQALYAIRTVVAYGGQEAELKRSVRFLLSLTLIVFWLVLTYTDLISASPHFVPKEGIVHCPFQWKWVVFSQCSLKIHHIVWLVISQWNHWATESLLGWSLSGVGSAMKYGVWCAVSDHFGNGGYDLLPIFSRYSNDLDVVYKCALKKELLVGVCRALLTPIVITGFAVAFWYASVLALRGEIVGGEMFAVRSQVSRQCALYNHQKYHEKQIKLDEIRNNHNN